jgi:hypothetical protein
MGLTRYATGIEEQKSATEFAEKWDNDMDTGGRAAMCIAYKVFCEHSKELSCSIGGFSAR